MRESEFRFDPERALEGLWKELDLRGVYPADFTTIRPPQENRWIPLDMRDATGVPDDESADRPDYEGQPDGNNPPRAQDGPE